MTNTQVELAIGLIRARLAQIRALFSDPKEARAREIERETSKQPYVKPQN